MDTTDDHIRMADDSHTERPEPTDLSKWDTSLGRERTNDNYWKGRESLFTIAWILGIGLGLIWILRNGRTVFTQWRENRLRRANRRRHGIPDDDDRPFNIAYTAAAQVRRERDRDRAGREQVKPAATQRGAPELGRQGRSQALRQRVAQGRPNGFQPPFIQENSSSVPINGDGYPPTPGLITYYASHPIHDAYRPADVYRRTAGPQQPAFITQPHHAIPLEHHRETDSEVDFSRLRRKSHIVESNFANVEKVIPNRNEPSLQVRKRGSKRHADPEGEEDWEMSRDKRLRKDSSKYSQKESDAEDISMENVSPTLEPRGTKRDREERDSGNESAVDHTDESREGRPTRRRRANGKMKVETPSRGLKRGRSIEASSASDGEETDGRRKRGRKHEKEKAQKSAVDGAASESDELSEFSKDPACGGRKTGEVWEVNGQTFKVGLDGRRLRHALVKQNRTKFPMPRDSFHADATTKMEIIVEKWLNDEEYKGAKDNLELAWQESPVSTPSAGSRTEEPSVSSGKHILWQGPRSTPLKDRASIGVSTYLNPFESAPSNVSRRTSVAHAIVNVPVESPKSRQVSAFSSWEKQDLEADSLRRMRARSEKEEKEKEKEEKEKEAAKPVESSEPVATTTPSTTTPLATTTNIPFPATASNPLLAKPAFFPLSASAQPVIPPSNPSDTANPSTTPTTAASLSTVPAANTSLNQPRAAIPTTSPSISFLPSAPSGTAQANATTVTPNPFALPTKATTLSAAPATATPTFTFNPTAPPITEQKKPQTAQTPFAGFPSVSMPTTTSTPGFSFSFNPTMNQSSAGPAQPNLFTFGHNPATTTPQSKPTSDNFFKAADTKTPVSVPATGMQPTTPSAPAPTPPTFSFNVKPAEVGLKSGETNATSTAGSNSLLNRLGPSATSGQTSTTPAPLGAGPTLGSTDRSKTQGFFFNANPAFSTAGHQPSEQNKPVFGAQGATSPFGQASSQTSTFVAPDSSKIALAPTSGVGATSKPPFGSVEVPKSVFGPVSDSTNQPSAFRPDPSRSTFGQTGSDASKNTFGSRPFDTSVFGGGTGAGSAPNFFFGATSSEPAKGAFGQPVSMPSSAEPSKAIESTGTSSGFGQSGSGPKSFFGATSSESAKGAFGQPVSISSSTEPSKVTGSTGAASSEAGKANLGFGQYGLGPKSFFGATPSEPAKSAFGQPLSTSSSTEPQGVNPMFSFATNTSSNPQATSALPSGKTIPVFGQKSAFGQTPTFGQAPTFGGFPSTGFGQNAPAGAASSPFGQGNATPSTNPSFSFGTKPEGEKK